MFYFKIFGCSAHCLNNQWNYKFSSRSKKGICVEFSEICKGYCIYLPKGNKVIISTIVKFLELNHNNFSDVGQLYESIYDWEISLNPKLNELETKNKQFL